MANLNFSDWAGDFDGISKQRGGAGNRCFKAQTGQLCKRDKGYYGRGRNAGLGYRGNYRFNYFFALFYKLILTI